MDRRKILILGGMAAAALMLPGRSGPAWARIATLEEALAEKSIGSDDAPVTIHAYESATCPHCAAFHRDTLPELKSRYVDTGQVRIVFHDFPLDARALYASMLARCAGDGRYFAMMEMLFSRQDHWARAPRDSFFDTLGQYGRLGGMTETEVTQCFENRELWDALVQRRAEAVEELDIRSTPTFIIGDERIQGARPIEEFEQVIQPMLDGAQQE